MRYELHTKMDGKFPPKKHEGRDPSADSRLVVREFRTECEEHKGGRKERDRRGPDLRRIRNVPEYSNFVDAVILPCSSTNFSSLNFSTVDMAR